MTRDYARVGVLLVALIVGAIATAASGAGKKTGKELCPGPALFETTFLNLGSGEEVPGSEGRVCRFLSESENSTKMTVTVTAKVEVESGSEAPSFWRILLGDGDFFANTSEEDLFLIGEATTGPGQSVIEFEDVICVGSCFNISTPFRAPFLAAVADIDNDSRIFISGFELP